MATFRVGQRVRIVGALKEFEYLIGKEAVVTSGLLPVAGFLEHRLEIDGVPPPPHCTCWSAAPGHLEPIQPERNQMVEWSECAWQPPHLREVVA